MVLLCWRLDHLHRYLDGTTLSKFLGQLGVSVNKARLHVETSEAGEEYHLLDRRLLIINYSSVPSVITLISISYNAYHDNY